LIHSNGASADPARQTTTLRLTVFGRVQGVGFRDGLAAAAIRLEVDGWVRNRSNGEVEAILRGTPAACDALVDWARQGPPAAIVDHLDVRGATAAEAADLKPGFRRLATR